MRRLLQCLVCLSVSSPVWAQERVADLETTSAGSPRLRLGSRGGRSAPVEEGMVWQVRHPGPTGQELVELWQGSLQNGVSPIRAFVAGPPEGGLSEFQPAGGRFFFRSGLDEEGGSRQLYASDGTRAGTYRLHDADAYNSNIFVRLWQGQLLALIELNNAIELSEFDPTTGQSRLIRSWPSPPSAPIELRPFVSILHTLYFGLRHPQTGLQFLTTDGSADGTEVRHELGAARLYPELGVELDDVAVFPANTPESTAEVWAWDAQGPRAIRRSTGEVVSGIRSWAGFARTGGIALFVGDGLLETTDGLRLGQARLLVDRPGDHWSGVVSVGEQVFLIGWEGSLWAIDSQLESRFLFSPFDGVQGLNGALWVVTSEGRSVQNVFRIDPETLEPRMITSLSLAGMAAVQNEMWLFVHRGPGVVAVERYSAEGESLGTLGEMVYPQNLSSWAEGGWSLADGSLVVRAILEAYQPPRLVRLLAGQVTDTWPVDDWGDGAGTIMPWQGGLLYSLDGKVMWLAGDGSGPQVLWQGLGRVVRFADLGSEVLVEVAEVSSLMRIDASMGVRPITGALLGWASTPGGAYVVNRGRGSGVEIRRYITGEGFETQVNNATLSGGLLPSDLRVSDGRFFARVHEPSDTGTKSSLWRLWPDVQRLAELSSDAEIAWGLFADQAVLVGNESYTAVDLESGVLSSGSHEARDPVLLGALQGMLLFSARAQGTGRELWRFDDRGMNLVSDIMPGPASGDPRHAAVIDGYLIFSAMDLETGRETWRSDGTAEGTWRLFDLAPGAMDGMPPILPGESYVANGEYVYFPGRDPEAGVEPHRFKTSMVTALSGPEASPPSEPLGQLAVSACGCTTHAQASDGTFMWWACLVMMCARRSLPRFA